MIERSNWKLVLAYLKYRKEVSQLSAKSLRLEETWLNQLLEWADDKHFVDAPKIRPTFPEYLLTARLDGKKGQLSPVYIHHVIRVTKNFFQWLRTYRRGFGNINQAYLDTLRPIRIPENPKVRKVISLEEAQAIARAPVYSMRDRRIRAAACFWFLSGIRIGAFVSLPLKAVDLEKRTIKQWPSLGVHTKFGKHETTVLLVTSDTQELFEIVKAWDNEVRSEISSDGLWFAPGSPDTGEIDPNKIIPGKNSARRAYKDLKEWCSRVGLPYNNPHAFRHGHAVYALKLAKNIAELKAVSQNLMHASISTTDGIYGILSELDVSEKIGLLGNRRVANKNDSINELLRLAKSIIEKFDEV